MTTMNYYIKTFVVLYELLEVIPVVVTPSDYEVKYRDVFILSSSNLRFSAARSGQVLAQG